MNRDRAVNGVAGLCANSQLTGIAQRWADWMAAQHTFQHQDLATVIMTTSFNAMAENLLQGNGAISVNEMESLWMASPDHRRHILDGVYRCVGVGTARSSDGRIWAVVDFGG